MDSQNLPAPPGGDRTALRPWHVEVGEDGGLTAIVGHDGRLVCDTALGREPVHPEYQAGVDGDVAADAALIVAAVNAYAPKVSTRAAVELATVRETRTV